ncbi:MAG: hypothetical protein M1834_007303 [Cirrosporium novae-zelandiae]|nr:MAG: hypothetical protein M1834_007303 [Cirrosporium novae-zelandiae]
MGLNSVLMGTTFIMLCTQCLPLDVFFHPWLYEDSESHCMNSKFTFLDVCILVLPIPTLWSLQVSFNKRLALLSVISCGGVGLIISIIRMITLHGFSADMDFVPLINRTVLMTSLEINAYILSANMPSLKAIWSKHITRSLVRSRGYKNGYTSGTRGPSRLTNPIQKSSHHVVEILASGTKSRNSDDHEMNTINSGSGDTRSDSQEQLFHNGQPLPHAIVVTHELGVGIERASQSPEFNREYYDFKEGTTKGVLGRRPSKILRGT